MTAEIERLAVAEGGELGALLEAMRRREPALIVSGRDMGATLSRGVRRCHPRATVLG